MTSAIAAAMMSSTDERLAARSNAAPASNADPVAFAGALRRAERAEGAQAQHVQAVRTRLDAGQASAALAEAYENVFGEPPRPETLKILTAQWAHETGNGASMFNYNFGGIKGASPEGLSVAQRTHEGWGKNEQTIIDDFRAYRTAEQGATDYVRLLSNRFSSAMDAARAGDPAGFVRGLKSRGYFTGNEAVYTRSIVALSGVPLSEGARETPPVLDVPFAREGLPASMAREPYSPPIVDALALADEISRAALRIARASDRERGS